MYFAGIITLTVFIVGGLLALAYKNPNGYSLLLKKCIKHYFKTLEVVIYFCAGIHFTLWSHDLITQEEKPFYAISNFSYVWVPLIFAFFLFSILYFLGAVTKSVKEAGEENS